MTYICLEPVLKNSNYYILLEELEEHFTLTLLFTCLFGGGGGCFGFFLLFWKSPEPVMPNSFYIDHHIQPALFLGGLVEWNFNYTFIPWDILILDK